MSEKALLIPAARELVALALLNFSMHSSISAGGAFFRATTARPQNSTSNFLAKAVADSGVSRPPLSWRGSRGWLVGVSSWRAELLLACLRVLMISGTWGGNGG